MGSGGMERMGRGADDCQSSICPKDKVSDVGERGDDREAWKRVYIGLGGWVQVAGVRLEGVVSNHPWW